MRASNPNAYNLLTPYQESVLVEAFGPDYDKLKATANMPFIEVGGWLIGYSILPYSIQVHFVVDELVGEKLDLFDPAVFPVDVARFLRDEAENFGVRLIRLFNTFYDPVRT
jgi:hypothetical protein